jgi:hypothetical protein
VSVSDDGFLTLMGEDCVLRSDVRMPDDEAWRELLLHADDVEEGVIVTLFSTMGEEKITACRAAAKR